MKKQPPRLILASASPRRKALLNKAGFRFVVHPSHVSERIPSGISHKKKVEYLAYKKAKFVSKKFPQDIVIGADTLVFINGHAVGKPSSPRHAHRILSELSGRWQQVITGVALVWEGGRKVIVKSKTSRVKFRLLSRSEIEAVAHKHLDKAGGYAVQEKKDGFVERIEGDYDNVVGFPMVVVKSLLARLPHTFSKAF
ncbi:MAG: Septum formation protein Maf [Elusimicrobia bacterium]|nr:Septum formation protein Maf [Elusimicrobiota bacterium]